MVAPATAAQVHEALTRTDIMALATLDDDGGSWTSPVQFRYDASLHLYFASLPDTRHVRNIHRDPRVSAAIYSYPGPPGGNLGLQIRGRAVAMIFPETSGLFSRLGETDTW
jgi:general stress protein 26